MPTQTWTKMAMLQKLLRSIRRLVAALDGWTLPEFMSVTQMGRFKEFAKRTAPWPPRRNYKLKRGATVPTSQPIRASATSSIIPTNASRHASRRRNTRSLPPRRPRRHEQLVASIINIKPVPSRRCRPTRSRHQAVLQSTRRDARKTKNSSRSFRTY